MKCPECVKEGKESTVQTGESTCTLMYWGGDGKDPNTYFQRYYCSNGHEWEEATKA